MPDLRFIVEVFTRVYQGIDTIVIAYRNQDDALVNEVLKFKGNLVSEGHGTYLVAGQQTIAEVRGDQGRLS